MLARGPDGEEKELYVVFHLAKQVQKYGQF